LYKLNLDGYQQSYKDDKDIPANEKGGNPDSETANSSSGIN